MPVRSFLNPIILIQSSIPLHSTFQCALFLDMNQFYINIHTRFYICYFISFHSDELPHWPQVYIEVLSLDSWQRYRTEGYTYITIPNTTGTSTHTLHCWRPTGRSAVSELRRFFIGGSPELEDTTYTAVSSTFEVQLIFSYIATGPCSTQRVKK